MNVTFLDEPQLEFGGNGRHIDIRFGIMGHGPLDRTRGTAGGRANLSAANAVGGTTAFSTAIGTGTWLT